MPSEKIELPPMEDAPVHIDIARMEKMLAGPSFTVPSGLTPEQFRQFMDTVAKVAKYQRELCAKLCDNVAAHYTKHYKLGAEECAAVIRKGT